VTSSASKSISVLHTSLRVAAGQVREAGDHVKAAALDAEAQAIEDALLDSVRKGLELLEAMACGNPIQTSTWWQVWQKSGPPPSPPTSSPHRS